MTNNRSPGNHETSHEPTLNIRILVNVAREHTHIDGADIFGKRHRQSNRNGYIKQQAHSTNSNEQGYNRTNLGLAALGISYDRFVSLPRTLAMARTHLTS